MELRRGSGRYIGMKYKEFGDRTHPTIILLHGGGLSWWSFQHLAFSLKKRCHIVTPVIDGHGEDGSAAFISIQDSAQKLIEYIDANYHGKVLAVGGVSLGAQIVLEVLSRRADIAEFAIVESALVVPAKETTRLKVLACKFFYGLMRQKWFAKIQANALCVKKDLFEQYYSDRLNISKQSLINIVASNGNYSVPDTFKNTRAKMLTIIGSKEIRQMDQSVRKLTHMLPLSQVCIVPAMKHGDLRFISDMEYFGLLKRLIT